MCQTLTKELEQEGATAGYQNVATVQKRKLKKHKKKGIKDWLHWLHQWRGMAVLEKKVVFIRFVISDSLAVMLSIDAVLQTNEAIAGQ